MTHVRHAAVAGMFYPGNPRELDAEVRRYLAGAPAPSAADAPPKAIIAPHAGYVYSGAVAATAYARLGPIADRVRRVVVIGPCHRVPVRGLAVSGADAFETPLGRIPVDAIARDAVLALPQVTVFEDTHEHEHSLEVQLPFLQKLFRNFAILPLVAGQATGEQVAQVIERLWGGEETIFVISSDLSHYLDYDTARSVDAATCQAIESLDGSAIGRDQACGRVPVAGILEVAKRRGLAVSTLDLRNSGDTAGDRRRVVGYGAWMFAEPQQGGRKRGEGAMASDAGFAAETEALLNRYGTALLKLAGSSIASGLRDGRPLAVDLASYDQKLRVNGASFVTLTNNGNLRGCIGSPRAYRPLAQDVALNAFAAAFNDTRFKPLSAAETENLAMSISVLSPPVEMLFAGEDHLLEQLRPGLDGLIIESERRRALFLPAVWESIPKPVAFIRHLKLKAGLPADHWAGDMRAWRFATVAVSSVSLENPSKLWT